MIYNSTTSENQELAKVAACLTDHPQAESDNLVTCRIFHRFDTSQEKLHIYSSSVRIKKPFIGTPPEPPTHTETTEFSRTARQRLYFFLENTQFEYKSQFVGTYHNTWPTDGKILNTHIDRFNKVLKRMNIRRCNVKEFQERGAPHVHWYLDAEYSDDLWKKLGKAWHKIAGFGSQEHYEWHVNNIRVVKGIEYKSFIPWTMKAAYPTKYLTKTVQKDIPEGYKNFGTFWGHSRDLKADIKMEISSQSIDEKFDRDEIIDYSTGEIIDKGRHGYSELYRTLGRYDEHRRGKKYSHFRNNARSTLVHGGAKIINQLTQRWREEDDNAGDNIKRSDEPTSETRCSIRNSRYDSCPF